MARVAAKTLTVDEALERILARVERLPSERIALLDALGAMLAADIVADRDVPPFRNSAISAHTHARRFCDGGSSVRHRLT